MLPTHLQQIPMLLWYGAVSACLKVSLHHFGPGRLVEQEYDFAVLYAFADTPDSAFNRCSVNSGRLAIRMFFGMRDERSEFLYLKFTDAKFNRCRLTYFVFLFF